jgi:hypothetical protein
MIAENEMRPEDELQRAERPAAEHLGALGATEEWERRAEWLESEAKAQRDPAARARLWLAASEVRALLGARADARRLAIAAVAHQPAPPFAARQARALHLLQGDIGAVTRSLADEAGSAETPLLAAHAHYLGAEVRRSLQRDVPGARASLDAAEAADSSDLRAPLARLVLDLSQNLDPPPAFSPHHDAEPLRRAVEVIRGLRGGPAAAPGHGPEVAVGLAEAHRALARGELAAAAEALAPLAERSGLASAVRWLRALLRAAVAARPEAALDVYRELARENPGAAARRAFAACAVAASDSAALREALDGLPAPAPSSTEGADGVALGTSAENESESESESESAPRQRQAFSLVDRVALAALVKQSLAPATAPEPLDAVVRAIGTAVARANGIWPEFAAASDADEAEFALGRAAALAPNAAADLAPTAQPWARLLRIEQSRARGDGSSLARELPRLFEVPAAIAEASFVAAVFAEKAGDIAGARELATASLPSPATREPATRALTERAGDAPGPLRALSAHTSDPLRRALLLTEALFRLEPGAPEFDALAEEAARTYPDLPFAVELGEIGARARGDRARTARWLSRRREHATGADDQALATLREVNATLDLDRAGAAERLAELVARYPDDLPLVLAAERLVSSPARARADFRRRRAPSLGPRGRLRFLAEAVGSYESAGELSLAFALAREIGGSLGELWAARLASTDAELDAIASEWLRAAQRTGDRELGADLYDRLAQLERRRGRAALALAWERERLALEPGSIAALRALHVDNMLPGREAELEHTASALSEALGEGDGLGHAHVAARAKIGRGAFDEARPFARRAHASARPPLWALRLDAVFARESNDDRTLLAACRSLRERSSQALDAAILSLHAAEAALRLGESKLARDDIQRAGELAPDDIVILSARAEVLLENGDHAEAAEAFETLASATNSKARQVDALYRAALLWLDALDNRARGMLALQEAASVDMPHAGLLERLSALRAQSDDLDGLAELIERQRALGARPSEAPDVDLARALDHADGGRLGEARRQLNVLLQRRPRDPALLAASAEVHARAGELELAEREWRDLLELGDESARLAALSGLIASHSREPGPSEQLERWYAQKLALAPDDVAARTALVALLVQRDAWAEASVHQRELLARAADDLERRDRLLYLVEVLDRVPGAASQAESLLEQARRTWSEDPRVLEAEVAHYRALGHPGTAIVIAERALSGMRDAIGRGRIEPAAFVTLEVAARLAADGEAEQAARAMARAIAGEPRLELSGAGARAGDSDLDELTVPPPLSPDLLRLLSAAGAAIERAYGDDLRSGGTSPAPAELAARVLELARGFQLETARVYVSTELGCDCRCGGASTSRIVLGHALIEHPDAAVQDFLVLRALALAKVNADALSRMASDDVWAVLSGFLDCFGPSWPVTGPGVERSAIARSKIRPHVTWVPAPELADHVGALADRVLPHGGEVGEALRRWAARVALLGVGDPGVALDALIASDPRGAPLNGEEARLRWLAGHAEAEDLVGYGVSEAYIAARQRAGVGRSEAISAAAAP